MNQRLVVISIVFMTMISINQMSLSPNASADSGDCQGDIPIVRWNETVSRYALTPSSAPDWWYDWEAYGDGEPKTSSRDHDGDDDDREKISATEISQRPTGPEESWMMYNDAWVLEPLKENLQATMLVGNDSAGAFIVNLSHEYKTTICVSVQGLTENGNYTDAEADIYLMTGTEFERYKEEYRNKHFFDYFRAFDTLEEIPPEWRSFNPMGWDTYRDAHQYENMTDVSFSVTLDSPEVWNTLWGEVNHDQFYIVVDAWDNSHSRDAELSHITTVADVTVIVQERGTILPNWTVSITCMLFLFVITLTPLFLNRKYMAAGLEQIKTEKSMIPNMEKPDQEE